MGGMVATMQAIKEQAKQEEAVVARRLRHLQDMLGLTGTELAEKVGVRRQWIESRTKGETRIKAGDERIIAHALSVPVDLLHVEEDRDFLRRCADLDVPLSRWNHAWAGRAA